MTWIQVLTIVLANLGAVMWMNGKFNAIDQKFAIVEKDMAVMKTVLIMKEIMPADLATHNEKTGGM